MSEFKDHGVQFEMEGVGTCWALNTDGTIRTFTKAQAEQYVREFDSYNWTVAVYNPRITRFDGRM